MKLQVKTQNRLQQFAQREPIALAGLMFLTQHIPILGISLFPIVAPTLSSLTQRLILQSSLQCMRSCFYPWLVAFRWF